MCTAEDASLGRMLGEARAALGASLQDVAGSAGCSSAYVHKLEQDRVRTPSPRVLAGLAKALGLEYRKLMGVAGYEPVGTELLAAGPDVVARFSNAHIVQLLDALRTDVADLRELVAAIGSRS